MEHGILEISIILEGRRKKTMWQYELDHDDDENTIYRHIARRPYRDGAGSWYKVSVEMKSDIGSRLLSQRCAITVRTGKLYTPIIFGS